MHKFALLALALLLSAGQCSFSGQETTDNSADPSSGITYSDDVVNDITSETATVYTLPATYPEDAPDMYPGSLLTFTSEVNGDFEVHQQVNDATMAELRAFYNNEATSKGWAPFAQDSEVEANDEVYMNTYTKENRVWAVTLLRGIDGTQEFVTVAIQVNTRPL
jgi:hypothetical protein